MLLQLQLNWAFVNIFSDINECLGINDCHANAKCTNQPGTYKCECLDGYSGNGKTCDGKIQHLLLCYCLWHSNPAIFMWDFPVALLA